MTATPVGPPSDRYGRGSRRRRIGRTVGVVALAVAFVGWVLWAAIGGMRPDVRATLVGFEALDESRVAVRLEVVADPDVAVACRIDVVDQEQEIVATTQVVVPPGDGREREVERVLRTRDPGVAATLTGCRAVSS